MKNCTPRSPKELAILRNADRIRTLGTHLAVKVNRLGGRAGPKLRESPIRDRIQNQLLQVREVDGQASFHL